VQDEGDKGDKDEMHGKGTCCHILDSRNTNVVIVIRGVRVPERLTSSLTPFVFTVQDEGDKGDKDEMHGKGTQQRSRVLFTKRVSIMIYTCIHVYMHTHTHTHIYIYIYK